MNLPTNYTEEQIQNNIDGCYTPTETAVNGFNLSSLQNKITNFTQVGKNKIEQYHLIGNGTNKPANRNEAIYLIQS